MLGAHGLCIASGAARRACVKNVVSEVTVCGLALRGNARECVVL